MMKVIGRIIMKMKMIMIMKIKRRVVKRRRRRRRRRRIEGKRIVIKVLGKKGVFEL